MKYSILTFITFATLTFSCNNEKSNASEDNQKSDSISQTKKADKESDSTNHPNLSSVQLPIFKDESINKFVKEYSDLIVKMNNNPTNEEYQKQYMELTNELSAIQSKMSNEEKKEWEKYTSKMSE